MEAHTHAHVEHHKTGHRRLDVVISVSALVTSLVSILLAYHTGHNMERLVHASSWPALQLSSTNGAGNSGLALEFRLINAGVGPARIHTVDFLSKGVVIPWAENVEPLLEACCAEALDQVRATGGKQWEPRVGTLPVAGSFLPPGEGTLVLNWPRTDVDQKIWDALDRARVRREVRVRTCYCSVFDECWIAETDRFPPRAVEACPSPPPRGSR
jgi:hypothetical protein